ncbi:MULTISPECIES: thioredoxin [unclassified Bartonella]|uniref:thioredoxin n=1 Tax=unclassified Bartonella TaxID=2645622 RepID=UPI0009997405|nr:MULTISPECIES: thioredoxin [unclassified Bartonella]AQX28618.1 thioredoxin [Bartonella sp. JB15]AQX29876.1 thioredoxin [Bartonella sp. JB63]
MTCIKIDNSNFESEVLTSSLPVVVDFWAEWCGPCKSIAPILDEIAKEMQSQIKVAKINIDESPELATRYGIRSIPTLLIFKNGEVSSNKVGASSKRHLADWIKNSLG